jgi:hypothetical protein
MSIYTSTINVNTADEMKSYIPINFRAHKINQDVYKLVEYSC